MDGDSLWESQATATSKMSLRRGRPKGRFAEKTFKFKAIR